MVYLSSRLAFFGWEEERLNVAHDSSIRNLDRCKHFAEFRIVAYGHLDVSWYNSDLAFFLANVAC